MFPNLCSWLALFLLSALRSPLTARIVDTSLEGAPTRFAFRSIPALEALGLDVGCDDMLQNFTTKSSQKMNGNQP